MAESSVFSKMDADRILQRAAEIDSADEGRPLSAPELRGIAAEAGFNPRAVERAIAEALQRGPVGTERTPVEKRGLIRPTFSTRRTVPIQLTSEQLWEAIRLFTPYREGPAQIELGEGGMVWRDRKGLRFEIITHPAKTELRVRLRKFALLRSGRLFDWVNASADRLESLLILVASRNMAAIAPVLPQGEG